MIVIDAINNYDICSAVEQMLLQATGIGVAGTRVEIGEQINEVPALDGWIGIYRERARYIPRALGLGTGFRTQHTRLILLVQAFDESSGDACSQRLESLIKQIVGTLLNDTTLKNTVENLDGEIEILYERYQKGDEGYSQMAAMYLSTIVPVRVTTS